MVLSAATDDSVSVQARLKEVDKDSKVGLKNIVGDIDYRYMLKDKLIVDEKYIGKNERKILVKSEYEDYILSETYNVVDEKIYVTSASLISASRFIVYNPSESIEKGEISNKLRNKYKKIRESKFFPSVLVQKSVSNIDEIDFIKEDLINTLGDDFIVCNDLIGKFNATPNDPNFNLQWPLNASVSPNGNIKAMGAWDTINSAPNIRVGILDSGVLYTHPDIAGNMWSGIGYDWGNDDNDPIDTYGHGTSVAGIIGAVGNNSIGGTGVAWDVTLVAYRISDVSDTGPSYYACSEAVLDAVINDGVDVINMSLGFPYDLNPAFLRMAVDYAEGEGVIVVVSAGNANRDLDSTNYTYYPAEYPFDNIVSVGGIGSNGSKWVGSNYGAQQVDIFAPGDLNTIYAPSIVIPWYRTNFGGTSSAAPHVSGSLALLKARFPSDSYTQIINRLYNSVDTESTIAGLCFSGGKLNLQTSVSLFSHIPRNTNGNRNTGWFGVINDVGYPYITGSYLGSGYVDGNYTSSFTMLTSYMGYIWTSEPNFPDLFRYSNNTWYRYISGTTNPRVFYNYTTGQYENFY